MKRRQILLAVSVVLIVLAAFMLAQGVEAQAISSSTSSSSCSLYTMKVSYQITGGGNPTAPVIKFVNPSGKEDSLTIPLYPSTQTVSMGKNKPWSVTPNPLTPSSDTERWISTQTLSGTTPNSGGSTTKTFSFQHQYTLTVNSAYDTPLGSGWYNSGATAYAQLSKTTEQGTSGTRYVFTSWSGFGISGTNQKSNSITMNNPKTATANWKTQYQVSFNINPYNSGTTTPSSTQWYDSGQTINIAATKKDSYTFSSWTNPASITISGGATATATIKGPGTITANFAKPKDTTLTVSAYPKTVDKIGDQATTITGRLTSNGQGVEGKLITLLFNSGNGDNPAGSAKTDNSGYYTCDWNPNDKLPNGLYIIKASFAGDNNFKTSNAATSCRGDLTVVPEYLFGSLAALGACIGGFVVFKKRSSLQYFKRL